MVLFYSSNVLPDEAVTIYAGKDKVENEELISFAWDNDVWFHVDKLSSPHIYLRLPPTIPDWTAIPDAILQDCAQLVKAGSIQGNKQDNISIIYTPASNLKKTGDMAVGQVGFHREKLVKRWHVAERINAIVNRLNKTKVEKEVNHEAERIARQREKDAVKRADAAKLAEQQRLQQKQWAEEKAARSYGSLFTEDALEEERSRQREAKEEAARRKAAATDDDYDQYGDDDFM